MLKIGDGLGPIKLPFNRKHDDKPSDFGGLDFETNPVLLCLGC